MEIPWSSGSRGSAYQSDVGSSLPVLQYPLAHLGQNVSKSSSKLGFNQNEVMSRNLSSNMGFSDNRSKNVNMRGVGSIPPPQMDTVNQLGTFGRPGQLGTNINNGGSNFNIGGVGPVPPPGMDMDQIGMMSSGSFSRMQSSNINSRGNISNTGSLGTSLPRDLTTVRQSEMMYDTLPGLHDHDLNRIRNDGNFLAGLQQRLGNINKDGVMSGASLTGLNNSDPPGMTVDYGHGRGIFDRQADTIKVSQQVSNDGMGQSKHNIRIDKRGRLRKSRFDTDQSGSMNIGDLESLGLGINTTERNLPQRFDKPMEITRGTIDPYGTELSMGMQNVQQQPGNLPSAQDFLRLQNALDIKSAQAFQDELLEIREKRQNRQPRAHSIAGNINSDQIPRAQLSTNLEEKVADIVHNLIQKNLSEGKKINKQEITAQAHGYIPIQTKLHELFSIGQLGSSLALAAALVQQMHQTEQSRQRSHSTENIRPDFYSGIGDVSNLNRGGKSKDMDIQNTISKVVHIRNVPSDTKEAEILQICSRFGAVERLLLLELKLQALVQFTDVSGAYNMVNSCATSPVKLRHQELFVQYSSYHKEIGNAKPIQREIQKNDFDTKVVVIRKLPEDANESQIIKFSKPYGKITNLFLYRIKSMALLEFDSRLSAGHMINMYKLVPGKIGGREVIVEPGRQKAMDSNPPKIVKNLYTTKENLEENKTTGTKTEKLDKTPENVDKKKTTNKMQEKTTSPSTVTKTTGPSTVNKTYADEYAAKIATEERKKELAANLYTRVVSIQQLPRDATAMHVIHFGLPFGRVSNVVRRLRNVALLEFDSATSAMDMVVHYQTKPATILGKEVSVVYADRQEIRLSPPEFLREIKKNDFGTKVVAIRKLPKDANESQIIKFSKPYGKITNLFMISVKSMALLEFDSRLSAGHMINMYKLVPGKIGGREVIVEPGRQKAMDSNPPKIVKNLYTTKENLEENKTTGTKTEKLDQTSENVDKKKTTNKMPEKIKLKDEKCEKLATVKEVMGRELDELANSLVDCNKRKFQGQKRFQKRDYGTRVVELHRVLESVTQNQIIELGKPCGKITNIAFTKQPNKHKKVLLEFATVESANEMIYRCKLQPTKLDEAVIFVQPSRKKTIDTEPPPFIKNLYEASENKKRKSETSVDINVKKKKVTGDTNDKFCNLCCREFTESDMKAHTITTGHLAWITGLGLNRNLLRRHGVNFICRLCTTIFDCGSEYQKHLETHEPGTIGFVRIGKPPFGSFCKICMEMVGADVDKMEHYSSQVHRRRFEILKKTEISQKPPEGPESVEYIEPVEGFFCKLCEVMLTDEEFAHNGHCKEAAHRGHALVKSFKDYSQEDVLNYIKKSSERQNIPYNENKVKQILSEVLEEEKSLCRNVTDSSTIVVGNLKSVSTEEFKSLFSSIGVKIEDSRKQGRSYYGAADLADPDEVETVIKKLDGYTYLGHKLTASLGLPQSEIKKIEKPSANKPEVIDLTEKPSANKPEVIDLTEKSDAEDETDKQTKAEDETDKQTKITIQEPSTIFVRNLKRNTAVDRLHDLFEGIGIEVRDIRKKADLSYAEVDLMDEDYLEEALEKLNGYDLDGVALTASTDKPDENMEVEVDKAPSETEEEEIETIVISNLKKGTTQKRLQALFEEIGKDVKSVKKLAGFNVGEAVLADPDDLNEVLNILDGYEFDGSILSASLGVPGEDEEDF